MAEKDKIYQSKLKHAGIFNFKDFYNFVYDWYSDEGYIIIENSYSEKSAGDAKEMTIKWIVYKKISDYFKFEIKINWFITEMRPIEVQKEGKKVKMNSGIIELKIYALLYKDYENRWEDTPVFKFLRGLYDRYIIRSRIDEYEDKLTEDTEESRLQMKAFLDLEGK